MNKIEVVLAMHKTKGDTSAVRKKVSRLVRHEGYDAQTLVINHQVPFTEKSRLPYL